MKKLFFITLCAIVALYLCSCEKSEERHNVAFLMSVKIKKIPADGFYNCKLTSDRAQWEENEYAKSDMPITLKVDGGAATWRDKQYTISFEYRPTQNVDPIVLCTTETPTLSELANYKGKMYPHDLIFEENTELGKLIYMLHYIYK